jgi:hypothetical protein
VRRVPVRSFYLTCTCGTCSYSSVTLAIRHKSLHSVLSPSDVYLWDPSALDLWDPTAYVSRVPVGPFSISIRPVGPDDLRVTLRVTCTYGTILHLHLTCGTRRPISIWPVGPNGLRVTWRLQFVIKSPLGPSTSHLWDPTTYVSRVPMGPFSISIRPVGPNDLCVTCTMCAVGL